MRHRKKMKTTAATREPAAPIIKFVANTWHQAHRTGVAEIILRLDNGVFRISLDSLAYDPPPANLFPFMVKEFLRYSGSRFWPWTKTVRAKTCCVEAGDTTVVWTMSSEDISMGLRIRRN
jgi:hypothetical protein